MKTCNIEGCDRPDERREWCRKHYERWRRHGDPTVVAQGGYTGPQRECGRAGCTDKHHARDVCNRHYHELLRDEAREVEGNTECEVCAASPMGGGRWCYDHWISEVVAHSPRMEAAKCGTQRGRDRHSRKGEPYCVPCQYVEYDWLDLLVRDVA